jgi:hypothetical protein
MVLGRWRVLQQLRRGSHAPILHSYRSYGLYLSKRNLGAGGGYACRSVGTGASPSVRGLSSFAASQRRRGSGPWRRMTDSAILSTILLCGMYFSTSRAVLAESPRGKVKVQSAEALTE